MTGKRMLKAADEKVECVALQRGSVKGGSGKLVEGHVLRMKTDDGGWVDQFHIKPSDHGLGLFAARDFSADEIISVYAGWEVLAGEASREYTFQRKSGKRVDAAEARRNGHSLFGAHFANSHARAFNCAITKAGEDGSLKEGRVRTDRSIDRGEELLLHYGRSYVLPPLSE
tara:strand:- start:1658 stop:2170 length:513 start_codon:yes stop_codon:yes gene_type:complete